jgi:hypothetical protein
LEHIVSILKKQFLTKIPAQEITEIFFYGADCGVEKCGVAAALFGNGNGVCVSCKN